MSEKIENATIIYKLLNNTVTPIVPTIPASLINPANAILKNTSAN